MIIKIYSIGEFELRERMVIFLVLVGAVILSDGLGVLVELGRAFLMPDPTIRFEIVPPPGVN